MTRWLKGITVYVFHHTYTPNALQYVVGSIFEGLNFTNLSNPRNLSTSKKPTIRYITEPDVPYTVLPEAENYKRQRWCMAFVIGCIVVLYRSLADLSDTLPDRFFSIYGEKGLVNAIDCSPDRFQVFPVPK